jgi:hypothetical protein
VGAALIVGGFFAPWASGAAEFASRDFSGFDLARLIRNFEIASPDEDSGRLRLAAVVMYLSPALAANAGVMAWAPVGRRLAGGAALAAALYAAVVTGGIVLLSAADWTELGRVLGGPLSGFWLTATGVGALAVAAALGLRAERG